MLTTVISDTGGPLPHLGDVASVFPRRMLIKQKLPSRMELCLLAA